MKIEPLTVHIGAQIKEVDLAELDEAALAEIKAALWQYQVLVFRNQTLSRDAHLDLGRCFGELHAHPALVDRSEHPE